jgi:hypothetical protein
MVYPMACAASSNDALQLVCFNPYNLLNPAVAPDAETISSKLHRTSRHPQENHTILVDVPYLQIPHLIVCECTVWELHVNVPRWIRHHDGNQTIENI